jgi:hypothetical protein
MNFIFGGRAKCDSDFTFRILALIQNVAALHENCALVGRNAKSFIQAIEPNHFRCGK